MNRFNLTFRGDILPGKDPARVKTRLGELLGISDPDRLAACFSGETVILRRNLDRKEAADLYAGLAKIGAHAELVKISQRGLNSSDTSTTTDLSAPEPGRPKQDTPKPGAPEAAADKAPPAPATAKAAIAAPAEATSGGTTYAVGSRTARTATAPAEIRRADLVSENHLENADAKELRTREKTLKKALRAKQKQAGDNAIAKEKSRKKAEAVEAGRRAALEKARRAALQLEEKSKAAEAAALQKAEQKRARAQEQAEREAEQAHRKHLAAERATAEAERQAKARREREEKAEQRREHEARQKKETAAAKAEEKTKADKLAAMIKADAAALKKQQADEIASRKAQEQRLKAEELARHKAAEAEQAAELKAMEEQAIQRAAAGLTSASVAQPVKSRVKTKLDLPQRKNSRQTQAEPIGNKHQPGAPNLYTLRPFRNTPEIQARAQQSRRSMKRAYILATVALAGLLLTALATFRLPAPHILTGASALAIDSSNHPLLVAGDRLLLLDRAGADSAELFLQAMGVADMQQPLSFADGILLATGRDLNALEADTSAPPVQLLRCDLAIPSCQSAPGELAEGAVAGITTNPLDGAIFLADSAAGNLRKVSPAGDLLASAELNIPPHPVLHLDSGLLLMNSAQASAISVFRYEDDAFGQQLDEILILPPSGVDSELARVWDFAWVGQSWWVVLYDPAAPEAGAGLYRFDAQWQLLGQVELAPGSWPQQLAPWGEKMLVLDSHRIPIQRFNTEGEAEAPLRPAALQSLADEQQRAASLQTLLTRVALAVLALLLVTAWFAGFGHRVRSLVYTTCRASGAEPMDKLTASIDWIDPAADRNQRVQRTRISYVLVSIALIVLAIGLGVSVLQLGALLLVLAGPAVALLLVLRSDPGHIGVVDGRLLLVDHSDMYHLGEGPRIQYRGPFLMIDDVTVFTGSSLLPAFNPSQLRQQVLPLAYAGVKVDRRIAMVKLLQGRHPMALGLVVILACSALAVAMLTLQGIY